MMFLSYIAEVHQNLSLTNKYVCDAWAIMFDHLQGNGVLQFLRELPIILEVQILSAFALLSSGKQF